MHIAIPSRGQPSVLLLKLNHQRPERGEILPRLLRLPHRHIRTPYYEYLLYEYLLSTWSRSQQIHLTTGTEPTGLPVVESSRSISERPVLLVSTPFTAGAESPAGCDPGCGNRSHAYPVL